MRALVIGTYLILATSDRAASQEPPPSSTLHAGVEAREGRETPAKDPAECHKTVKPEVRFIQPRRPWIQMAPLGSAAVYVWVQARLEDPCGEYACARWTLDYGDGDRAIWGAVEVQGECLEGAPEVVRSRPRLHAYRGAGPDGWTGETTYELQVEIWAPRAATLSARQVVRIVAPGEVEPTTYGAGNPGGKK